MKKGFFFLLFLIYIFETSAQSKTIDSLQQALTVANDDTNKIKILNSLGYSYQWNDPKKTMEYCLSALSLSQRLVYKKGELDALYNIGEALAISGNYTKATELKFKFLEEAEKLKDEFLTAKANTAIAAGYFYQGDYEQTIKYSRKSMAIPVYYEKYKLLLIGFLGESFYKLNRLDSALYYSQRAYEIDLQNKWHWPVPYYTLAGIHQAQKHYDLALEYFKLGLDGEPPKKDIADGHLGIAKVFAEMEKNDSALFYARTAIAEAKQFSFQAEALEAAVIAKNIFKKLGIKDSAFAYQEIVAETKDSLFSQEKMRAVQNLTFSEQLRQQELEMQKIKASEQRRHNLQYAAIIIGLITFIILFVLLSRSIIVKTKFIEFFGALGLLAVFEFINLFIHPYLSHATNDSPALMLVVLIAIGALLIPLHHKLEKWITGIMVEKNKKIRLESAKKTIKQLEG